MLDPVQVVSGFPYSFSKVYWSPIEFGAETSSNLHFKQCKTKYFHKERKSQLTVVKISDTLSSAIDICLIFGSMGLQSILPNKQYSHLLGAWHVMTEIFHRYINVFTTQ